MPLFPLNQLPQQNKRSKTLICMYIFAIIFTQTNSDYNIQDQYSPYQTRIETYITFVVIPSWDNTYLILPV